MSALCNLVRTRVELLKLTKISGLTLEDDEFKGLSGEALTLIMSQISSAGKLDRN